MNDLAREAVGWNELFGGVDNRSRRSVDPLVRLFGQMREPRMVIAHAQNSLIQPPSFGRVEMWKHALKVEIIFWPWLVDRLMEQQQFRSRNWHPPRRAIRNGGDRKLDVGIASEHPLVTINLIEQEFKGRRHPRLGDLGVR